MNTPANRNKPYLPLKMDQAVSYESIGTSDCVSFGHFTEQGKQALEAETLFRQNHPDIKNVTSVNDLHGWLNNSSCTVDACYPLISRFAEHYKCPFGDLVNLIQRCIIQTTVESAHRLYHVMQTHQLFNEGAYDKMNSIINDPPIPPPIWAPNNAVLPVAPVTEEIVPVPVETTTKEDNNVLSTNRMEKLEQYTATILSYTPDELFLDMGCKIVSFNKVPLQCLQKLCRKIGIEKYTTMKKEAMVDVLNAYKKRYNDFPSFRFQHYYSQDHCNAFDCKNTKIARLMDSMQWKYCEKHLKSNQTLLVQWELTINSSFKDLREGVQLTKEEAVLHYSSYFFNENETNETTTRTVPFVLQHIDQPMLKCNTKKPKTNLRAMLMKGKTPGLSKPKYPQLGKMKQSYSPSSFCDDNEYIEEELTATNTNEGSDIEDITAEIDISHDQEKEINEEDDQDEDEDEEENDDENEENGQEEEEEENDDEENEFEDFSNDCEEGEIVSCSNTKKRPANKYKKEQASMKFMKLMK